MDSWLGRIEDQELEPDKIPFKYKSFELTDRLKH